MHKDAEKLVNQLIAQQRERELALIEKQMIDRCLDYVQFNNRTNIPLGFLTKSFGKTLKRYGLTTLDLIKSSERFVYILDGHKYFISLVSEKTPEEIEADRRFNAELDAALDGLEAKSDSD